MGTVISIKSTDRSRLSSRGQDGTNKKKIDPFYGTARWQRFRNWYKRSHPLCEDCLEQDKVIPVYCVDHFIELKNGGEPFSTDNARSLCRKCHTRKTVRERQKRKGESSIEPAGHISTDGVPLSGGHHWNK